MSENSLTIDQIRKRFSQLNQERLEKTEAIMVARNRALVGVIPLLFHINHSSLPGYVDEATPAGVSAYVPEEKVLQEVKKHWRGFDFRRQPQWTVDIEALFLMGSCGTIAFSKKSDFDIWLCYRPGLDRSALKRLQKKARLIEAWYEEKELELHFFLMNAERFKKGKVTQLSTESSGTAQHYILLDEFYRSSIWLAGKTPFWWYVPPSKEKNYEKMRLQYEKSGDLVLKDCVDFGGLPDIPSGEFFGAAVWQIYKGIDSPYKSVLKITLMEAYANSYPESTPLAAEFKQQVYENNLNAEDLDPYLKMLHRSEQYLKSAKKNERLEVLRRSFYLKLNMPLSDSNELVNWRKKSIQSLTESWGWSDSQIKHLDKKNFWTLEDVVSERKLLVLHLTESYSFLSNFARKHAKKRIINQKDLSILGRKLYAVFDRKPGKIEIFNRGIVDDLTETSVTIMLLHGKDKRDHWRLYRGKVVGEQFKDFTPLKHSFSMIELVVWGYFNRLLTDSTQKLLYAPGSDIGASELQVLLDVLSSIAEESPLIPDSKDFLKNSYVQQSEVFLNIGKPLSLDGQRDDMQLVSGELDILNYGAEGLVQTLEYFYITSWKEIFVYKYYGADGIAQWLCELLEMYTSSAKANKKVTKVIPNVRSFGSQVSNVLSRRIGLLCESIVDAFIENEYKISHYIYEAGKKIYSIKKVKGQYSFLVHESSSQLMASLAKPTDFFVSAKFSEYSLKTSPMPIMFSKNKKDVVQMFLQKMKTNVLIFIFDESGSVYYQKLPLDSLSSIIHHFECFFSNITERKLLTENSSSDEFDEASEVIPLAFYMLKKEKFKYVVSEIGNSSQEMEEIYHIQVVGDVVNKKTTFTFFCDEVEISSMDWGSKVFREVAKHVIGRRKDNKKYYVYITDLTLSAVLLGKKSSHSIQTIELLQYKKKIEESLNKALVGL